MSLLVVGKKLYSRLRLKVCNKSKVIEKVKVFLRRRNENVIDRMSIVVVLSYLFVNGKE